MKKKDYAELDASILRLLHGTPCGHEAIKANDTVRRTAIGVTRRRSGTSPSESTETTIMERLNQLRLAGRISYDHSSRCWNEVQAALPTQR
jgi:hypothetical protein